MACENASHESVARYHPVPFHLSPGQWSPTLATILEASALARQESLRHASGLVLSCCSTGRWVEPATESSWASSGGQVDDIDPPSPILAKDSTGTRAFSAIPGCPDSIPCVPCILFVTGLDGFAWIGVLGPGVRSL